MVGRAGRSKGCYNCRRRKKGCDLVRPFCGQCARAKTQCGGYDDSLNMVLYSPMVSSRCLQTSLENRALEVHYVGVFWELFLPATPEGSRASGRDWTRTIRDHYTSSCLVKDAMLALTLSRTGKHTKNHNVASSGRTHYTNCLRQITQTINRQKDVPGDDVIAACLVLGLYEQMCSPALQGSNWQSHMQGIGTLMQLRGPHAFASGSGHHLFVGARLNLIFSSLGTRQATFLESNEWLTVPWSNGTSTKSIYDRIVDILARIPGILEMLDRAAITKFSQPCDTEPLLDACWRLDDELQRWFRDLVEACTHPGVAHTGSSYSLPDLDVPLGPETVIDHEHAQALVIYWMASLCLHVTLRLVWEAAEYPLYLLPQRIDPVRYATLTSKSLAYFLKPGSGEGALVYFAMFMGIALQCYHIAGLADTPDFERLTDIWDPESPVPIGKHIGFWLRTLAASGVGAKIDPSIVHTEYMMDVGKRYWGGGKAVALPLRIPSPKPVRTSESSLLEPSFTGFV